MMSLATVHKVALVLVTASFIPDNVVGFSLFNKNRYSVTKLSEYCSCDCCKTADRLPSERVVTNNPDLISKTDVKCVPKTDKAEFASHNY